MGDSLKQQVCPNPTSGSTRQHLLCCEIFRAKDSEDSTTPAHLLPPLMSSSSSHSWCSSEPELLAPGREEKTRLAQSPPRSQGHRDREL